MGYSIVEGMSVAFSGSTERHFLVTGLSTIAFVAVFLFGGRIYPLRAIIRNQTTLLGISAGVSLAYVFVHVIPELSGARQAFVESTSLPVKFEGMIVYFLALVGYLVFYTVDHLSARARRALVDGERPPDYDLKLVGFSAYVCLISYLLVNNLDTEPLSTELYALAMAIHFLAFDHGFREVGEESYRRRGCRLLAAGAVLGWVLGWTFVLPRDVLALMLSFLSGGIIVNAAIGELESNETRNPWPLIAGSLVYSAILIPLR